MVRHQEAWYDLAKTLHKAFLVIPQSLSFGSSSLLLVIIACFVDVDVDVDVYDCSEGLHSRHRIPCSLSRPTRLCLSIAIDALTSSSSSYAQTLNSMAQALGISGC